MKQIVFSIITVMFVIGGIGMWKFGNQTQAMEKKPMGHMDDMKMKKPMGMTKTAVFAGGCFWCTESDFEKVSGVYEAVSGYTGGDSKNPTYKDVSYGRTTHIEAVQVTYDPKVISYEELLDVFWRHIDPTDNGGQFVDRGNQYRSAVFYANEKELALINKTKDKLNQSGIFTKPIVTQIRPLDVFYRAEEYHQDFYKKSPKRYHNYRSHSGRDQFIKKTWKNHPPMKKETNMYMVPTDAELKKKLTRLQYKVVRKNGTEPPFKNEFWDNNESGIYVDIVSGEPLFSSKDKFKSGTGWPSFTRPLVPENVLELKDTSHFMVRTEVRSKHGDSHLGHLFNDGPKPTGLRYCINSASLRFIPEKDLEKEGYGHLAMNNM